MKKIDEFCYAWSIFIGSILLATELPPLLGMGIGLLVLSLVGTIRSLKDENI
jgi:hypothetical protein